MDHGSRNRLTDRQLGRFPGETLFDRIARAVCHAGCLPRKELFEAWEVARRVRRRFRGGRVVDLACGHGLLASLLLLLDDSSPAALGIDRALPASAAKLQAALAATWPRLDGRVELRCGEFDTVQLTADDLVVSVHACGDLTDRVVSLAIAARARLAVLPCCHDLASGGGAELRGWLDGPLAMDVTRAAQLQAAGYRIVTQLIPAEITPQIACCWPSRGEGWRFVATCQRRGRKVIPSPSCFRSRRSPPSASTGCGQRPPGRGGGRLRAAVPGRRAVRRTP